MARNIIRAKFRRSGHRPYRTDNIYAPFTLRGAMEKEDAIAKNKHAKKKARKADRRRLMSAQQTIPYVAMYPDGVCQLPGGLYTKTVEYEDINYSVASLEDQSAIFSGGARSSTTLTAPCRSSSPLSIDGPTVPAGTR